MDRVVHILLAGLLSTGCVAAMDRWSALSMIESADNDHAIGRVGEVSRYQIKPAVWNAASGGQVTPRNPKAALAVAQVIMRDRGVAFERRYHRLPTDFEFYVLWNAPAQLIGPRDRAAITKVVAERARRFSNLVALPP